MDFSKGPHRGMRPLQCAPNPDNFIGVELTCSYSIGPAVSTQIQQYARDSARRRLAAETVRLARYFHKPVVHTGEIREETCEETTRRGLPTYRMYFYQMIEITEANQ